MNVDTTSILHQSFRTTLSLLARKLNDNQSKIDKIEIVYALLIKRSLTMTFFAVTRSQNPHGEIKASDIRTT